MAACVFGSMEIWDHTRLQAEGRFRGLDAEMQPPTACREDEANRVRSVVPKLIANGESHALERGSPARGLRIGQSRGGKARGGGEEGGGLLSARDCGMASEKNHSRERDEGRRRGKGMCAP